jgi:hypothetical protein
VVCDSDHENLVPNVTVIARTSSSGEARASNLRPAVRRGKHVKKSGLPYIPITSSTPGSVSTKAVCQSLSSSTGRCQFHSLITGILLAGSNMFYDLSQSVQLPHPPSIGCSSSRSQKMFCLLISNRYGTPGETGESAISSRTSNHSLVRLMNFLGI